MSAASPKQAKSWPLTSALSGAIVGNFVWAIALLLVLLLELLESWQWSFLTSALDIVRLVCMLIAAPVQLVGYLLLWGDDGPAYEWLNTPLFSIGFGLIYSGLLGAIAGLLLARKWRWRIRTRFVWIAFTTIAVVVGLAVSWPF